MLVASALYSFGVMAAPVVVNGCQIQPKAQCPGVNLANADLRGVDLSGANLAGAKLTGANLSNANVT